MTTKKSPEGKIERKLKQVGARMDRMLLKAQNAKKKADIYLKTMKDKKKVTKLKKQSEEAWKDIHGGLGKAWKELSISLKKAQAEFKRKK